MKLYKYLGLMLLAVVMVIGVALDVNAASWATEQSSRMKTHYTTLTDSDTSTDELAFNQCSDVTVIYNPSSATSATLVAQIDIAGNVSHTVISGSDVIAVSGTTSTLPYGTSAMQLSTADILASSTIDVAVVERRFINCQKNYLE